MTRTNLWWTTLTAIVFAGCTIPRAQPPLLLADRGATDYRIVLPADPPPATSLAADVLARNLKRKTGADFAIATNTPPDGRSIFVGVAPGGGLLPGARSPKPPADLAEDEFVTQSVGGDIYLYGEGPHGAFNAVVDFMERQLGWRWFNFYDEPVIPAAEVLALDAFARTVRFRFPYRIKPAREFFFYQGANQGFSEVNEFSLKRYGRLEVDPRIQSRKITPVFVHSCYGYIPPDPERQVWKEQLDWIPHKRYAETHPEFFAMREDGSRTPHLHLCWSNRNLRDAFTATLEEQVRRSGPDCILVVDTGDDAARGPLCLCDACRSLSERYGTLAGPCLDYVFEVARTFAVKHPGVILRTELFRFDRAGGYEYRIPALPDGASVPPNVSFFLAQKGYINRPIDHSDNGNFHAALQAAAQWCPNLALWSYPHPFFQMDLMPFSALRLQVENFHKVRELITTHFDETGFMMYTFNGLETYVLMKHWKDETVDVDRIVREYTEGRFGAAAADVRAYQEELEDACVNWQHPLNYSYSGIDFRKEFAYLTPARLLRWQRRFDRMMDRTAGDDLARRNLGHLRISLDAATLARWNLLAKSAPQYFADAQAVHARLEANRTREWHPNAEIHRQMIDDWMLMIELGDQVKPLPPQFAGLPGGDILRVVPVNYGRSTPKIVKDPDAAFGYAATIDKPDLPFTLGFHQFDLKAVSLRKTLAADELPVPGAYALVELGEVVFSPNCILWFSSRSWMTHAKLGGYYDLNVTTRKWTAYVSLKFPLDYAGTDSDQVLCDQILLVKKPNEPMP